jgi:hypothetical protein
MVNSNAPETCPLVLPLAVKLPEPLAPCEKHALAVLN